MEKPASRRPPLWLTALATFTGNLFLVVGSAILALVTLLVSWIPPRGAFYLWILAVLLSMLACLYLTAAHDPRRYSAIIAVAIGGRAVGAAALAAAALVGPDLGGLFPLAAADLAFSVVHAGSWWPIRS